MTRRDRASSSAELGAGLERAALRALGDEWAHWNQVLFRGALVRPQLALGDARIRLGAWMRGERRVELSRALITQHRWGAVVEVLKHEMAHQYVDEVLGCRDEPPHGPSFLRVCEERGIDARAAGDPRPSRDRGRAGHDGERDPAERRAGQAVLDRVQKLLALADSANEHEAQAAMSAAQRILLRHNLELRDARRERGFAFRHLGRATGRVGEAERLIAQLLADHFFVETLWVSVWRPLEGKRGSVLEACGRPENLEIAEYVYAYLLHTAEQLWVEHRRRCGIRGNRDRRAYVAGVVSGFQQRLSEESARNAGSGLVWSGDPELSRYVQRRYPYTRTVRRASSAASAAHGEGRRAGRELVLRRGVRSGTPSAPAGRLLPAPPRGPGSPG